MAEAHDTSRTIWIIGAGAQTATTALGSIGLDPLTLHATDESPHWQETLDVPNLTTFLH